MVQRTIDFYTDKKKRVRPIRTSGRMKGAKRSRRYAPSNVWGYASHDYVIRDATDPFDPKPKPDNWEVMYKGQRIFSGLTKSEATTKTHEHAEALRKTTKQTPTIKGFTFEDTNRTYPTGFSTVTKQMRLEKRYPDDTIETWSIELNRAPKDKMFYRGSYGVMNSVDSAAKMVFPKPTYQEFYAVKQSFSKAGADKLGGFQTGASADITDKGKLEEWLKAKEANGYYQVPYIMRRK